MSELMKQCPLCGTTVQSADNFCLACGHSLLWTTFARTQAQSPIERPACLLWYAATGEVLQEYVLDKREMTIGRETMNDIVLSRDKLTSRHHATIHYEQGSYLLRDEGSENGTAVNGEPLPELSPQVLQNGDQVSIGEQTLLFRRDGDDRQEQVQAVEAILPSPSAMPLTQENLAAESSPQRQETFVSTDEQPVLPQLSTAPPTSISALLASPPCASHRYHSRMRTAVGCLTYAAIIALSLWWVASPLYPFSSDSAKVSFGETALIALALGLLVVAGVRQEQKYVADLNREGITVWGQISERKAYINTVRSYKSSYYVTYSYDYQGKTYSRQRSVSADTYSASHEGDRIIIYLFAEDPRNSRLTEEVEQEWTGWFNPFKGCLILWFILLLGTITSLLFNIPFPIH